MQTRTLSSEVAPTVHPVLEAQQRSWNAFSPGWDRWDDFTMDFLRAQGDAIVAALDVDADSHVLDIATGTGEPGLTLARQAFHGRVVGLDASEGMLAVARQKAEALGVKNFVPVVGDACALPLAEASVDAVSCRLGFMFFPEVDGAAREIARVLRPGGAFATTVWAGPAANPWITTLVAAIREHLDFPAPPAGAPGMFRCAEPAPLSAVLESAGLHVERVELIQSPMVCASRDAYWDFMVDVVPPVVAVLREADAETVDAVKRDVFARLDALSGTERKTLPAAGHLLVARRAG